MLIDGKLVNSESGKTFANINPATEEVLGEVADGTAADMHRAIDAARRAFDETTWSTDHAFRRRCLEQLQDAIEADKEEMREELILETGCPRMLTYGPQLDAPLREALLYPAKLIDEFEWETELPDAPDFQGNPAVRRIWKEAVGVVGAIVPWNFPFEVTINKLGQALATGNTVVLKPAPDTPFNATRLGRLIAERTDIPAGVVNVVTASDHLVGEELTVSPKVDLISFTGSTAVGKRIMEKGAATIKRLFLELGGKSATIVLDDADLGIASFMGMAVCTHAGQGCAIPSRMLLPRSRYEEGVELVKQMLEGVPYGDPQRADVLMGPVISAKQRDRVMGYIDKGVAEGATLVVGGKRAEQFDKGFFIEPTMFIDVDNSMTIAQEEIFGPVLVVIPFDDDDDAVRIANESVYGLGGAIFSSSPERSHAPSPGACAPARSTSTAPPPTSPTCPSAVTSGAASGARTGSPASTSTSRSSRSPGRRRNACCIGLSEDQQFFRETTARFLFEHAPPAELRRLRDDATGFEEKYWKGGTDLGWTSLLVDEAHGGGTISGNGLADLAIIAYEFGRHAAPGPLIPTNVAASALSAAGGHDLVAALIAGTAIVTWTPTVTDGVARPVESASQATHILAGNRLIPTAAPGVTIKPMHTVDLTRRFDVVTFEDVSGAEEIAVDAERLMQIAIVMASAESVGAMQSAFEMTVEWAFDRYSFGRPLASYQALKHRFADMKLWLEASHAISDAATAAVAASTPDAAEIVSIAKAYIGQYGSDLVHECVQLHGGIGVTFEHDLHFFVRRHTVNRALYGTPADHRQRIAEIVL